MAVTGTATLDAARTVAFGSTFGGGTGPARAAIDVAAGQTFAVAGLISELANPGILVKTGPGTHKGYPAPSADNQIEPRLPPVRA